MSKHNIGKGKTTVTYVVAVAGVVAGIAAALLMPYAGLSNQAAIAFGILVWAVIWWVIRIFPEMVTALFMAVLFVALAGIPVETVLQSFTSETWWLLFSAFALGVGMSKSGLVKRIAHAVLGRFPNNFKSQALAIIASGTIIGPFIPSMSAKLAVITPLAMGIGDSLGYQRKGRQMKGLFLAALTGVRTAGPLFISACVIGYGLLAFYPEDVQNHFNMLNWFIAALPWFLMVSVINYLVIVFFYGPKSERRNAAKGNDETQPAHPAHEEELGPMSPSEKRMLIIIVATLIMWVLEPLHGIPAVVVGMAAVGAFLAAKVCTVREFREAQNWENLIFIGIAMGLTTVFSYTGIDTWVVNLIAPAIEHLAFSPYLFVAGTAVVTVLLRFFIVSEMAFINIFMAFMAPLSLSLGINPWVTGIAVYAAVNPWFLMYQNPIYMAAFYSVDGKMVDHAPMAKYCAVYLAICIVGLMASVPYWQVIGVYSL